MAVEAVDQHPRRFFEGGQPIGQLELERFPLGDAEVLAEEGAEHDQGLIGPRAGEGLRHLPPYRRRLRPRRSRERDDGRRLRGRLRRGVPRGLRSRGLRRRHAGLGAGFVFLVFRRPAPAGQPERRFVSPAQLMEGRGILLGPLFFEPPRVGPLDLPFVAGRRDAQNSPDIARADGAQR